VKATLLDATGEAAERGKIETTVPKLTELVKELRKRDELVVGQEVGKQSYLVHDTVMATGTRILSFNSYHLRMIASSRKKTDRRDAYWIAKALQTGMTPTPVYIPTGEVRELRMLLSRRQAIASDRKRWKIRARTYLQAAGLASVRQHRSMSKLLEQVMSNPNGIDEHLGQALELCQRMHATATIELNRIDAVIHQRARNIEAVQRLLTIPGVGEQVALMIYAWVGDVGRFRSARELASYAGLVPTVRQSGSTQSLGGITRMGSPQLRTMLVQAGHALLWRCRSEQSLPLKALAQRVHSARKSRKIAVIAAARHILRLAYYVLRDGTLYDPTRLRSIKEKPATS
jgi:transposase